MSREGAGRRKPIWDDFSGGFTFESKTEILKRTCQNRQQKAEIHNRSEAMKMEHQQKQNSNALHIFEKKLAVEMDDVIHSQRDVVAHKVVLSKLAAVNDSDPFWDKNLGKYGGVTHSELLPLIEKQKTKLTASHKRRKAAQKLLLGRKEMQLLDRKLDTDTLLTQWRHRRLRSRYVSSGEKSAPKLKLPPIQVTMADTTRGKSEPCGLCTSREGTLETNAPELRTKQPNPVFLTDMSYVSKVGH